MKASNFRENRNVYSGAKKWALAWTIGREKARNVAYERKNRENVGSKSKKREKKDENADVASIIPTTLLRHAISKRLFSYSYNKHTT